MKPHPVQYKTYVVEHPLQPGAAVGIEHLPVFCHDHVRGLVAILPHVVAAQVERRSGEGVLRQWDVAEHVLGLCRPRKHPALAQ